MHGLILYLSQSLKAVKSHNNNITHNIVGFISRLADRRDWFLEKLIDWLIDVCRSTSTLRTSCSGSCLRQLEAGWTGWANSCQKSRILLDDSWKTASTQVLLRCWPQWTPMLFFNLWCTLSECFLQEKPRILLKEEKNGNRLWTKTAGWTILTVFYVLTT